ncbi:hypothetical protein D3C87_649570 [compost metagenome]
MTAKVTMLLKKSTAMAVSQLQLVSLLTQGKPIPSLLIPSTVQAQYPILIAKTNCLQRV